MRLKGAVVGLTHTCYRDVGWNPFGKVEPVIGRQQGACTCPLPLMGVTEAFTHGGTYLGGFPRAHPDDGVRAGDIGELELVDASLGVLNLFGSRVVQGRHVPGLANLLELRVLIGDGLTGSAFPCTPAVDIECVVTAGFPWPI